MHAWVGNACLLGLLHLHARVWRDFIKAAFVQDWAIVILVHLVVAEKGGASEIVRVPIETEEDIVSSIDPERGWKNVRDHTAVHALGFSAHFQYAPCKILIRALGAAGIEGDCASFGSQGSTKRGDEGCGEGAGWIIHRRLIQLLIRNG